LGQSPIRSSLASAQLGGKTTGSLETAVVSDTSSETCAIREEVKKSEVGILNYEFSFCLFFFRRSRYSSVQLLFATKAQRREVLRLSEFIRKSINYQINQLYIVHYPLSIDSWGVAPNPTYFFALMQKSMQKRSRLHLLIDPTAACSLKDK
jgi:hypothetical protein